MLEVIPSGLTNPYLIGDTDFVSMFSGDDNTSEEFIALKNYSTTEDAHKNKTLSAYWSAMVHSYPRITSALIRLLMSFPSTWLCEAGFSALLEIKKRARNKLIVEPDLRQALATVGPYIDTVVVKGQHQLSR